MVALLALVVGTASPVRAATLTVTKTTDTNDGVCDVDCSLREAIAVASPGDAITIPAGTYTLTFGSELLISKNLTLTGAGSATTIVEAATGAGVASWRVFNVASGNVAISGLTIRHGNLAGISGGGINNSFTGTLTLTNSTVSSNTVAFASGGGIQNAGTLTLNNSTVSGNTAGTGGGIVNFGTLTVTNSTFSENFATIGGAIATPSCGVLTTVTSSTFSGNSSDRGGGIYNCSTLTVTNSIFSANSALNDGGAILNIFRTLTVTNSTFSSNSAKWGGGIENTGVFPNEGGTLNVTNSSFSGNLATFRGGAIYNHAGTLNATNSTFSGNSASSGGANANEDLIGSTATFRNTIVANSVSGGNCSGTITDGGGNLSYPDATCPGINADPKLGPLQDNGGPTLTHALLAGSPAIDAGDNIPCPATDQRGFPRPRDGDSNSSAICDIGAYEFGFSLRGPVPGVAGATNTLEASGASPGSQVLFIRGSQPGPFAVPGCAGATVDIGRPEWLATVIADANGNADLSDPVPLSFAGRTVRLQAVQRQQAAGCLVSNLVVYTFP
jgi:CSLREA domain-containing protein